MTTAQIRLADEIAAYEKQSQEEEYTDLDAVWYLLEEAEKVLRESAPMNRVAITVEGGLVQAVNADEPVAVTIIDFDVDNDEAEDVKTVVQDGRPTVAAIGQYESAPMNDMCRAWIAAANTE